MSDYRKLRAWQRSMDFVATMYQMTRAFPSHEQYGLTSQIRRAATSIALNIIEGASSGYDSEYQRFLRAAVRSANEVSVALEIAARLGYCTTESVKIQAAEAEQLAAMLQGLIKSIGRVAEPASAYLTDEEVAND